MSSSADFSAAPGPADRRPATTSRAQAPAKPFLLLSTRAEDAAAHAEQLSFARAAGLAPAMLHQLRLERERPKALDLERYGGVIVGGGPYNASDESKSAVQLEVEAWFDDHLAEVLETDFPFFGACYGVGLLGTVGRGRDVRCRAMLRPLRAVPPARPARILGIRIPSCGCRGHGHLS